MPAADQPHAGLAARAAHEFRQYVAVALYLFVCFAAVLFYKAAVLRMYGLAFTPLGLAAVKALILGKFMLIGHALHVGEQLKHTSLIYRLLFRSFVFLLMLLVLSIAEEMIRAMIEGVPVAASLDNFAGGTWQQVLAVCFLMWLVLLPYFAFRMVDEVLGEGSLRRMFFARR